MAKLLFCCAVLLVVSVAAHLKVGNATAPRTNGTTMTSSTTPVGQACIDTRASGSGPYGSDTRGHYTNGVSSQCVYYKNNGECNLWGTLGCEKTCDMCVNVSQAISSTITMTNTASTTVTTSTAFFVFPSSQLPRTWKADEMPMVIDVPVSPAAFISGVHIVSDWWMKRPKDIEIKLLGSGSGSSSPPILASISTVYPTSLTICGPHGDLPCSHPVTPTSTHKVSINSSDLVSTVRVSLLSPLNAAGTPNDDVIIQEVVVVMPGQTSPAPPTGNVLLDMFAGGVNCGHVPALNGLTKVQSVQLADINIPLSNSNNPKIFGWQTGNNWVARFTATLLVSASGFYTFSVSLGSADTAELWVNGQRIIQSGCNWGNGATGGLQLTSGPHSILLWYADDGWKDRVILSYQGSDTGGSSIVVPSSRFVLPTTTTAHTTTTSTITITAITTNTTVSTTTSTTSRTTTATTTTNTAPRNIGNATAPRRNATKNNSIITMPNATLTSTRTTTTTTTTIPRKNATNKNSTTTPRNVGNATPPRRNVTKKNFTTTSHNIGNGTEPGRNVTKKNSIITMPNATSTTAATTTTTTTKPQRNVTKQNSTIAPRNGVNPTVPRRNVTKQNSTVAPRNIGNATVPGRNVTKGNSTIEMSDTTSTTAATTTTTTMAIPRRNVTKNSTTTSRNVENATPRTKNVTKMNSTTASTKTTSTTETATTTTTAMATTAIATTTAPHVSSTSSTTDSTTIATTVTLQHHASVETRLGMEFGVSDPTSFSTVSMVEAVANASGTSSANVALVFKKLAIDVSYTFSKTIDEKTVAQAVAIANSVSASQVVVQITSTRRLEQGSKSALRRRLVAYVKATITVPNVTQAKAVSHSSTINLALQSALASQGFASVVATMSVSPKLRAQVEVAITTRPSQVGSLSTQQLANVASQIGGAVTVTSVRIMTTTATTLNTTTTTKSTTGTAATLLNRADGSAGTRSEMLSAGAVMLIAGALLVLCIGAAGIFIRVALLKGNHKATSARQALGWSKRSRVVPVTNDESTAGMPVGQGEHASIVTPETDNGCQIFAAPTVTTKHVSHMLHMAKILPPLDKGTDTSSWKVPSANSLADELPIPGVPSETSTEFLPNSISRSRTPSTSTGMSSSTSQP